jgi:hypothetical protein
MPPILAQATAFVVGEIHAAVTAHGAMLGGLIAQTASAASASAELYAGSEAANAASVNSIEGG